MYFSAEMIDSSQEIWHSNDGTEYLEKLKLFPEA